MQAAETRATVRPAIDLAATADFETATFALG
jgi:hypothetical protein